MTRHDSFAEAKKVAMRFMSKASKRDDEWATAAVRAMLVRVLLSAAQLYERMAEVQARRT